MKWGNQTQKMENRVTKLLQRAISTKGFYILLVLTALVLLSGASEKWGK
jgi:hypothetical protein